MFRRKQTPTKTEPPKLIVGSFIETEAGVFYIKKSKISGILRHPVTPRVLKSWAPISISRVSEGSACLKNIKLSINPLMFRNGSLIYSQSDGKMYLVSEYKLRHITNPDWLQWLGLERSDAMWVSKSEIEIHEIGEPLE